MIVFSFFIKYLSFVALKQALKSTFRIEVICCSSRLDYGQIASTGTFIYGQFLYITSNLKELAFLFSDRFLKVFDKALLAFGKITIL